MRATFLGTGTSTGVPSIGCRCKVCTSENPRDRRLRSSLLIQTDDRRNIIVDTGPDLRQQCLRLGLDRVDGVLITHAHMDHILGIDDLRRFNSMMETTIDVYATGKVLDHLTSMFPYAFSGEFTDHAIPALVPCEITHSVPFTVAGAEVMPLPISHGKDTITCFIFDSFAYVTDCSGIPDATREALTGIEALVLGALRNRPHPKHFSFEEAAEAARAIGARRTYLTHVGHECLHSEQETLVPAEDITFAYDGMEIDIAS